MQKKPIVTPNQLTLFRVGASALVIYFLFSESFMVQCWGVALFIAAVVSDFYDGYLARKYNIVTNFGKIADPIADKILTLGMFIAFSRLGLYPFVLLLPIIIREVLVTGIRIFLLFKNKVIAAEAAGKWKVGFQVGTLVLSWICLLIRDFAIVNVGQFFNGIMIFLYVGVFISIALTLYSGMLFFIRNASTLADVGIARLVGTFFYCGLFPWAPGTWGSMGGMLLFLAIVGHPIWYGIVLVGIIIAGVWSGRMMSAHMDNPDPSCVVIDEVAGMLLTYAFMPLTWFTFLFGFVLFRIFDILKPWPIKQLEPIPRGYGIMADDLLAGIFANIVLRIIYVIFFV